MSQIIGSTLGVVLIFCASSAMAETISSQSYKINGNLGGNFGGQTTSSSYSMSSIGGEAIVGDGSSGSYLLDQRQSSAQAQMLQLEIQPSGLVGYYPLDESAGTTTADASRYQNDGSLTGNATWYSAGKIGSAIDMNTAGAVRVPDNTNLPSGNAMTLEVWAYQSTWQGITALATHWLYGDANGASWALQTGADHNLRVFIAGTPSDPGDNYVDTATNTWNAFSSWHHVAMVYDGTQAQANKVKVYVDGALQSSTVYGTLPSTLQNSNSELSIGNFPGLGRDFNGALDQVKIFNRALSASEISAEYQAQNVGVVSGLTLGSPSGNSTTSLVDAIVRTDAQSYSLAVQQDHDLQSGVNTIPSVSGSIPSPQVWNEGVTKGVGFTLTSAPSLDGKWNNGANYAAIPSAATTFYTGTGHINSIVDVVQLRLRLDPGSTQAPGAYSNNVTYTGTTIP